MEKTLRKYLPENAVSYVRELLRKYPVRFVISKPRKTKLGDYRFNPGKELSRISVNGNLNKYAFLITTIHEFAHHTSMTKYGRSIQPHGQEWQNEYRKLMLPVLDLDVFPNDLEQVVLNSLIKVKASSCSDHHLSRVLLKYDETNDGRILLEELSKDIQFELNGKILTKGNLRRTRYVCFEDSTRKTYLVHKLAKVKTLNKTDNGE